MNRLTVSFLLALVVSDAALAQQQVNATRPRIGDTVTTASGLRYLFVKQGNGPRPQTGDHMIIHGIGLFTDGKEFWNTRTENAPWEYTFGVDRIIRGTEEGLREVREGDRVHMIMKPELAYGARGNSGSNIPGNATLVFDYEVLGVKSLTLMRALRDGLVDNPVDSVIARIRRMPNMRQHFVSAGGIRTIVRSANTRSPGDGEKILKLSVEVDSSHYQLHQDLARAQGQRGAVADAIRSYESAIRLNPKLTTAQKASADEATKALAALRGGFDRR